jgi:hypothetical protein
VNHRHLLPDEIDLLLDGEVGFGVAPLRAHADHCAECSARIEESRALIESLEHLPELAPSPMFADRVMANVNVFVPWHVAARDAVMQWMPRSRPMRVLAGATGAFAALVLSLVTVSLFAYRDVFTFFVSGLAFERSREIAMAATGDALASLFGETAAQAVLATGSTGLALVLAAMLMTAALALITLRRLVVARGRIG